MASARLAVPDLPLRSPPHQDTLSASLHFGPRRRLPPVGVADRLAARPLPPSSTLSVVQAYPERFSSTEVPQPVHVDFRENTGESSFISFPAGLVSCAPCGFVFSTEDVAMASMESPALRTHLGAHHLISRCPGFPGDAVAVKKLIGGLAEMQESHQFWYTGFVDGAASCSMSCIKSCFRSF